jgi:sec-independent protein translocase protein TatC
MTRNGQPDADDLFADTRMSFGDHIEDLRIHLWRAVIGFGVAIVLSFTFSWYVLDLIKAPVVKALREFNAKRDVETRNALPDSPILQKANLPKEVAYEVRPSDLARLLVTALEQPPGPAAGATNKDDLAVAKGLAAYLAKHYPTPQADAAADEDWVPLTLRIHPLDHALIVQEADRIVKKSDELTTFKITEGMMIWLEVSLICGLVLGSPWIFYQLWSFVGAGLYSTEKKLVHVYMPFSLALFLFGVFLCELVVIPQAVRVLLEFNAWLNVNTDLRLEDWLSFALMMPVVFGVSFQTPLVMLFLAKVGIFDAESFRAKRRIAWFVLAVTAALIMPSTDPSTILMMQLPLIGLYEFGILLAAYVGKKQAEEEVPDPDEMVGV